MSFKESQDKIIVCVDCGTNENVKETFCPYSKEVKNKEVKVNLCNKCYRQRSWDI